MNTFKDYLKYRLKSSLLRTVAFAVIALVITYYGVSPALGYMDFPAGYEGEYNVEALVYAGYLELSGVSQILAIAAAAIAVLETAGFKNKRNLDTLYSLPLSRFQLALAHYLNGALQVFAIYTSSALCAIVTALPYADRLRLEFFPAYYLLSLIFGLGFYSFVCFFFGEGNTVADGASIAGMWLLAAYAFIGTLDVSVAFAPYRYVPRGSGLETPAFNVSYETWGLANAPISNIAALFTDMIGGGNADGGYDYYVPAINRGFAMFYVWGLIYAACGFGYFYSFVRKGAEKAGEISSSPFGYKFLVPFFACCLIFSLSYDTMFFSVIVIVLMVIGYVIYRRGIKLKESDILMIAAALALVFAMRSTLLIVYLLPLLGAVALAAVCLIKLIASLKRRESKEKAVLGALCLALAAALLIYMIVMVRLQGWSCFELAFSRL